MFHLQINIKLYYKMDFMCVSINTNNFINTRELIRTRHISQYEDISEVDFINASYMFKHFRSSLNSLITQYVAAACM